MAGSYMHLRGRGGQFEMDLIENMGDAHEALEQCFDMIEHLAGGDVRRLYEAWLAHWRKRYPNNQYEERIHGFETFRQHIEQCDAGGADD